MKPISMSFCINDKYAQHLAVVLTSILVNNSEDDFIFHVLHSNVTDGSIARVKELEKMYPRNRIVFHHVDPSRFSSFKIPEQLEHVSVETYYRYLLPELLPTEDRTIYSDVDVLCVGQIRPLWETDLGDHWIAAVSEGDAGEYKKRLLDLKGDAPYFNAGILLLDLNIMRTRGLTQTLFANTAALANRLSWPDQDVINYTCRNKILQLDNKWNAFNHRYSPFRKDIVLWHFACATQKPWCNIWKNRAWPLYLRYLRRSPYRDQAWPFIWGHLKGFFYFKYTKKGVTRHLLFGLMVWKHKAHTD